MAEQTIAPDASQALMTWAADAKAAETTTLPDCEKALDALVTAIEVKASQFHEVASHAIAELEACQASAHESQDTLTKAFDDVQASLKTVDDRCQECGGHLDERFDQLESSITDANTQIDKWEADCGHALDAYVEAMNALRTALETTDDNIEKELTQTLGEAEQLTAAATEVLRNVAGDLTQFGTHLEEHVNGLTQALAAVGTTAGDDGHAFDEETRARHDVSVQALTEGLQEQPLQAIGEWDSKAAEALNGLGNDVTSTVEQFDSTIGRLLEPVSPILDTVEKIKPVLETAKALL